MLQTHFTQIVHKQLNTLAMVFCVKCNAAWIIFSSQNWQMFISNCPNVCKSHWEHFHVWTCVFLQHLVLSAKDLVGIFLNRSRTDHFSWLVHNDNKKTRRLWIAIYKNSWPQRMNPTSLVILGLCFTLKYLNSYQLDGHEIWFMVYFGFWFMTQISFPPAAASTLVC